MEDSELSFRIKQLKSVISALADAATALPVSGVTESVQCLAETAEQISSDLLASLIEVPAARAAS